ncbi:MAG: uroporphyrinogen-III synthase [Bacteroidales bacterium]|nr:uroporphyrinogen-III synthase [Bacteroidales bacterium]MDD2323730.1 uroporphyrinogen-III synthase [Bacteroidales bacterium]MDD3010752.1 uroporphyrinogen-III synthase [Bacteroidales bacterium]MDD3961495.1 uroporphyrinogen-III synthase [Bacteroidales bacterium]MDY0285705.1 uroporphyrinogen-III synthase [Bacteroidales bacterium]
MKIKNVLISQPQPADPEKSPYFDLAKKHHLKIDYHKFIKIEGISARDFRKDKVYIQEHSAIIFTSRNAVDHFFRVAEEMRVEVPDTMKYFCVSESVAFYLQKYVQYRKRKIFHGQQCFADLIDVIKKHKNEQFLLPCSDIHKEEIPALLEKNNIAYNKAILYRTVASDLSHLDLDTYDLLVFFSPSGVASLLMNFPDFRQGDTQIAAFGPTTAKAVADAGLTLNINAPTKTAPSMSMAIDEFLKTNKK